MQKHKNYKFVSATYIPLNDSTGTACDCCSRLIANIVTIEDLDGKRFQVGKDCAKVLCGKDKKKVDAQSQIAFDLYGASKSNKPFYVAKSGAIKSVTKGMMSYLVSENQVENRNGMFYAI